MKIIRTTNIQAITIAFNYELMGNYTVNAFGCMTLPPSFLSLVIFIKSGELLVLFACGILFFALTCWPHFCEFNFRKYQEKNCGQSKVWHSNNIVFVTHVKITEFIEIFQFVSILIVWERKKKNNEKNNSNLKSTLPIELD